MEQNTKNTVPQKKSAWSRLRNWFKNGFSWLTGNQTVQITTETDNPSKGSIEDLLESIRTETEEYKKYLSLPEIESNFMHGAIFMLNTGVSDGIYNNRTPRETEIKVLSESRAIRLCDIANAALTGNLARVTTEEEAAEKLMDRNKKQDAEQHRDLEKQLYYQRNHSRSYNWIWGILCFFAAVGLGYADYPLSLKLLADGFNFGEGDYYPTAIGLILCTFFIKIYFDNYVDVKYGDVLLTKRDFYDMYLPENESDNADDIETEKEENKKELKRKKRWYTILFFFTIAGIIVLSFFRSDAVVNKWNGDPGLRTATFLFLTLIFPIISGICLSVSLNVFENCARLRRTRRHCKRTTKEFIESLKKYTVLKEERENIENELKKWNSESAINTYTTILLAYYDNGFKRGSYEPDYKEKELDFFERVENWQKRIFTRKSNLEILKSSEL